MLAYWGRRGPISQLTLELARNAMSKSNSITFSVSISNELFNHFAPFGEAVFGARTFESPVSAFDPIAIYRFRRQFTRRIVADGTRAFVSLMSHIWSPTLLPIVRRAAIRHTVVVHEVDPHTGEPAALVYPWLMREAKAADHVVTLSRAVAEELSRRQGISPDKITVLFHPDLSYGDVANTRRAGEPIRLLFFGRLLPYKGMDIFLDALEILREEGRRFTAGIFGAGDLEAYKRRISTLGLEVVNRWMPTDEIAAIFSRHDLVVLCHTVASQSGVVAAAHGANLPVIVTPVGGLMEQVVPGVTGLVAKRVNAEAIAAEILRVIDEDGLLGRLQHGITASKGSRSVSRFFDNITAVALQRGNKNS
jgi:glycosyltransferase involved in cell wall biosynthesis